MSQAAQEELARRMQAAVALHQQGRLAEAIEGYRALLDRRNDLAPVHNNLGAALWAAGRAEEAIASYRQAVGLAPRYAQAQANLGAALADSGRPQEGFGPLLQATRLEPDQSRHWQAMARALRRLRFTEASPEVVAALEACFARDGIIHQTLVNPALSLLTLDPAVQRALALAAAEDDEALAAALPTEAVRSLFGNRLLHALLTKVIIPDDGLETLFTKLRRLCLEAICGPSETPLRHLFEQQPAFLAALACQCFASDYAYAETPAESEAAERLAAEAGAAALRSGLVPAGLIVAAMYRPLYRLAEADQLAARLAPSEANAALLHRRQLLEPLEERRLAAAIPALTAISDPVSAAVRAQYEEHPYPRWQSIWRQSPRPIARIVEELFPQRGSLDFDPRPLKVLIAGCGSGKAVATVAMRYAEADILAVDLSRRSLGYAARRAQELGLTEVRFGQADILDLATLEQRFHMIESIGVLHHMADPLAGWRILAERLEPGGFLRLGLYSRTGRRHFSAARAFLQARGFPASEAGIRAGRQAILALEADRPERGVMAQMDFYSLTACRDFLFNVQEEVFSLPEIEDACASLGLELLGLEIADPLVRKAYAARFPDDPTMSDLNCWDRFEAENPDTFSGLYIFWCRKP